MILAVAFLIGLVKPIFSAMASNYIITDDYKMAVNLYDSFNPDNSSFDCVLTPPGPNKECKISKRYIHDLSIDLSVIVPETEVVNQMRMSYPFIALVTKIKPVPPPPTSSSASFESFLFPGSSAHESFEAAHWSIKAGVKDDPPQPEPQLFGRIYLFWDSNYQKVGLEPNFQKYDTPIDITFLCSTSSGVFCDEKDQVTLEFFGFESIDSLAYFFLDMRFLTVDPTGQTVKKAIDGLVVISFDLVSLVKDPSQAPAVTHKQYLKDVSDIPYNKVTNLDPKKVTNIYKRTLALNSLSSFSNLLFRSI